MTYCKDFHTYMTRPIGSQDARDICMTRPFRFRVAVSLGLFLMAIACAGRLSRAESQANPTTVLGLQQSRFTVNEQPTFLLGISYYGALGAPDDFIRRDLDDLQRYGFNWLRVWATWRAFDNDVSAVDARGEPRAPYIEKLKWLVAACDRRGMVVDVSAA